MKKLALVLGLVLWSSAAFGQCTGVFPPQTLCGNLSGASAPPAAYSSAGLVAALGAITGPGSSTLNGLPLWANTLGSQLKDGAGQTVAGSYTWSGAQTYNTGVTIAPAASTLNQSITTTQSVSGTTSVNCIGGYVPFPCVNLFSITGDNANAASPSNALDGWQFTHNMGGSSLQGARQAVDVIANFTAPSSASNTNRNYVAGVFEANATSGDGGTNTGAGALGALFGSNVVARTSVAANNFFAVTGMEIDVNQLGTSHIREGLSIVSFPGVNGTAADAAIAIASSSGAGAVAWNNGILFSTFSGLAQPISAGGCAMCFDTTAGTYTIGKGIDLSNVTVSLNAFKSVGFAVDGNGVLAAKRVFGSSGIPTASSCPGFVLATASTDLAGRVTFTSATSCAISFSAAFNVAPFCIVQASSATTATTTVTTTTLTATFGAAQTQFTYICMGA